MGEHTPAPTPGRGVYGFVLYLTCVSGFVLYLAWALIPDSVLFSLGITYYPQKYWVIALPIYVMMGLAMVAFFIYPALNLALTPSLDDITTVRDGHSVREAYQRKDEGASGEGKQFEGIPPVYDIHISDVCKTLYLNKY